MFLITRPGVGNEEREIAPRAAFQGESGKEIKLLSNKLCRAGVATRQTLYDLPIRKRRFYRLGNVAR